MDPHTFSEGNWTFLAPTSIVSNHRTSGSVCGSLGNHKKSQKVTKDLPIESDVSQSALGCFAHPCRRLKKEGFVPFRDHRSDEGSSVSGPPVRRCYEVVDWTHPLILQLLIAASEVQDSPG